MWISLRGGKKRRIWRPGPPLRLPRVQIRPTGAMSLTGSGKRYREPAPALVQHLGAAQRVIGQRAVHQDSSLEGPVASVYRLVISYGHNASRSMGSDLRPARWSGKSASWSRPSASTRLFKLSATVAPASVHRTRWVHQTVGDVGQGRAQPKPPALSPGRSWNQPKR